MMMLRAGFSAAASPHSRRATESIIPPGYVLSTHLQAIRAISAGWNALAEPTAPTITSTINVPADMSFATALGTNGAHIIVSATPAAATYSISGLDQRIEFLAAALLTAPGNTTFTNATALQVTGTARRIHIKGPGGVGAGSFYTNASCQDVRIDSRFTCTTQTNSGTDMDTVQFGGTRVLLEGSSIFSRTYCAYNSAATDLIIANSQLVTTNGNTQATFRSSNSTRVVVIDSRLKSVTHHNMRAGGSGGNNSSYVYWARNQLEGGGMVVNCCNASTLNCDRLLAIDNNIYHNAVDLFTFNSPPSATNLTLTGNRGYSDITGAAGVMSPGGSDAAWTVTDNSKVAYQTPPVWGFQ